MASKLQAALSGVSAPSISLKGVQGASYQAQAVQPRQTKSTDYAGGLLKVAQLGTQAIGQYSEMQEKQALKRSNEILNKFSKEEIGAMRKSGILLYQDDPWAMRALNREIGRQEAYAVDSTIAERISKGDYNSSAAMDEDRNKLLMDRRKGMPEAFGLSEDDEGFNEGFNSDMGQRNVHLFNSQAVKEDAMKRNEARVVIENNIASLTRSGQVTSQDVNQYLQSAKANGLIRNDNEYETYVLKALDSMTQRGDSVRAVEEMLNSTVELYGQQTTLRDRLGQEGSDVYRNKALETNVTKDMDARLYLTRGLAAISNPDFTDPMVYEKSMDKLAEMVSYVNSLGQSPQAIELRVQVEQAGLALKSKLAAHNAEKAKELTKQKQTNTRLTSILYDIDARVNGEIIDVFRTRPEDATTGSYKDTDYAKAMEMYAGQIKAGEGTQEQKDMKMMQVAALFKDQQQYAFGSYYKTLTGDLSKEMQQYDLAIQAGTEPPETPIMNSMVGMYKVNPEMFLQTFGQDAEFAIQIATAESLNINPTAYRKGAIEVSKLDEGSKRLRSQEMLNKLTENGGDSEIIQRLPTKDKDAYLNLWTALDGMTAPERTKAIISHMNANNVVIKNGSQRGVASRSFLNLNPNSKDSVKEGQAVLESFMKSHYGNQPTSFVQQGDNLIIFGMTGTPQVISKQILLEWNQSQTK